MVVAQRLNKSIIIEQPTETRDANGVVIQTWATYYSCKAAIVPLNGREYFQARQVAADVTTRFRLRYCNLAAGITAKMRVNWGGIYYDIESAINPQQMNREIILMAVQKNA